MYLKTYMTFLNLTYVCLLIFEWWVMLSSCPGKRMSLLVNINVWIYKKSYMEILVLETASPLCF